MSEVYDADILTNLYECHEIDIMEGDGSQSLEKCGKNPGHKEFTFLDDFKLEHLPVNYRNKVVYDCVKSLAQMTVQIKTTLVSEKRPLVYKGRKYPYGDKKGSKKVRNGSGRMDRLVWHKNEPEKNCYCQHCITSDNPKEVWMEVFVMTANHVVFDDDEAKQTTCYLFYNDDKSPDVILTGKSVEYSDIEKDRCQFKCATCDPQLMDTLSKLMEKFNSDWKKAYTKYKLSDLKSKLVIIVSHPHGHCKRITVGYCKEIKKADKLWTQFFYSTPTCPGSSGAAVLIIGHTEMFFYQHIHSASLKGLNLSGIGW